MTNRFQPSRSGLTITILLVISSMAYLETGTVVVAQTATSGFKASQAGQIGGAAGYDTIWADGTAHRWMMTNENSSSIFVAAWPCLVAGCIPYAGAANTYGVYPESQLLFPVSGGSPVLGLPLLSGNNAPQWGGGTGGTGVVALDLQTGSSLALALASEVPNDTSTGTVVNKLARISTTGAIKALHTDPTSNQTYVVATGAGTSATVNAQLALAGEVSCIMDSPVSSTAGMYVVASTTSTATDGMCSATATPTIGAWIVGQMISNSTVYNTPALILARPGYRALSSSILGSGTSLVAATSLSTTSSSAELATVSGSPSSGVAQWDGSGNIKDSGIVAANILTLNAPATGAILSGAATQTPNTIATGTYGFPLASAGSGIQPTYQRQLITAIPSSDVTCTGPCTPSAFATTLSIPANVLAVGSVLEIHVHGIYLTTGTSSPVFALAISSGGSSPVACPASSTISSIGVSQTGYWDAVCYIQVNTTGGSGSAIAWGSYTSAPAGGSGGSTKNFTNTGAITYVTNVAETISVQETATTVTGQTFTLQSLYARVIY
jgi:hypothetical protein